MSRRRVYSCSLCTKVPGSGVSTRELGGDRGESYVLVIVQKYIDFGSHRKIKTSLSKFHF